MKISKPAIFFDRDGVLNEDFGYVSSQEFFQWKIDAIKAIKYVNENDYYVFVVTNQSGIARGFYTEKEVNKLHLHMVEELKKNEAHIDEFRYCPHHPQGTISRFRRKCTCRKPSPGMIISLIKKWNVDTEKSIVIGDKESDLQAGIAAGIAGYLMEDENLLDVVVKLIGKRASDG